MNYTIAIADDEEMMRKGLTTMIPWREWGYEVVVTAPSGRALIDALEKESVDVVLTDITMDDMTGLDVAKYVHDNLPDTVTVVISGFVEFDFAQEALKQGVFKYLLKPVSLKDMHALAEELVPEIERRRRISHLENQYWNGYLKPVDRFIAEGARGALKEERVMKSRAAFFGIEDGFLDRKCMMMSFILSLPTDDRLDPPSVFQAIFQRLELAADCHVIYCEGGWVRALLTSAHGDARRSPSQACRVCRASAWRRERLKCPSRMKSYM